MLAGEIAERLYHHTMTLGSRRAEVVKVTAQIRRKGMDTQETHQQESSSLRR